MRENNAGRALEMLETVASGMGGGQSLVRDKHEHNNASRPRSTSEYACECASKGCNQMLSLSIAEYNEVRSDPTHILVARGHADPRVDAVVRQTARYQVVQKYGAAATVAPRPDA